MSTDDVVTDICEQQAGQMQQPPVQGPRLPGQGVPQIRNQVNISQQQRMSSPLNLQAQQRALQVIASQSQVAQAQAQAIVQTQQQPPSLNGIPQIAPAQFPAARDATSSPAQASQASPPRSSATPSNASPRPISAVPQVPLTPTSVLSRPMPAQYYAHAGFTPEQINQMRANQYIQAQAAQAQAALAHNNSYLPPS